MAQITTKPTTMGAKTKEEIKIIQTYFFPEKGCLGPKEMTDAEYDNLLKTRIQKLNIKQKALNKLGIDESEVNEIEPVVFEGFNYSGNYMLKGIRSSKYEITWLFFSDKEMYMYNYIFDMISSSISERTEEYFYKDITNFSSMTESIEYQYLGKGSGCGNSTKWEKGSLDSSKFSIIVPGDKFSCSMLNTPDFERKIQGMKQKLREKKN